MKVVWTEEALAHLDDIYQYIARDAPFYAKQTVNKLTRRSEHLTRHPRSGRPVPEYEDKDLRELIVFPYRLVYRVRSDRLDVIAVFHGAQQLSKTL